MFVAVYWIIQVCGRNQGAAESTLLLKVTKSTSFADGNWPRPLEYVINHVTFLSLHGFQDICQLEHE